jgi:serine protease Do
MEDKKQSVNIAKVALLSSLISIVVLSGLVFILRVPLAEFLMNGAKVETTSHTAVVTPEAAEPLVDMIEKVNPAVVSVVVTKDVPVYEEYYERFDPWGFLTIPRIRENGTEEKEVGGGSGFVVSNDGMIVTNHHVVSDESARYSVVLIDGTVYPVDVLAKDADLDIAVLKIAAPLEKALTFIEFGDSNTLKLGQTVVAIGNALAEFQNSVSVGVISGLSRSIVASDSWGRSEQLDQVIQTDAAINPGNSGGPLLNLYGEVVGVNVATSQGADNIGFALPASAVKRAVDSVREFGEIVRPFLGVRYSMVTKRMAEANSLPVDYGALVVRGRTPEELAVMPGSPADKAGIVENDIILSIDGEELRDKDLASILRTKTLGQEITLEVFSKDNKKTVTLTLEKAPK